MSSIKNIKGQIYEEGGYIFLSLKEGSLESLIDIDNEGRYSSVAISEKEEILLLLEVWYLDDLSAGVMIPPENTEWKEIGSFEIGQAKYRIWDTGIRLPRINWYSTAL